MSVSVLHLHVHVDNNVFVMVHAFLDHTCTYPGCTNVLVIDGNCKNRRDVCAATEAGFIEYGSLPGMIMTGCQHTPMQSSPFCCEHAPRVSVTMPVSDTDNTETMPGSMTEKAQHKAAEKILSKKETRNKTYYQVQFYI